MKREKPCRPSSDSVVSRLCGIALVKHPKRLVHRTDQVAGGLPSRVLRGIALPEGKILNALSPFVLPTAAYSFDHIVRLPLDLLDWWWGLVTTLDGGLSEEL